MKAKFFAVVCFILRCIGPWSLGQAVAREQERSAK